MRLVRTDGTVQVTIRNGIEGNGLIATKLQVPPVKAKMLPREHLVRRLSEGKDHRLIVVTGLAGSGKTSLVSQWVGLDKLPTVWYSLDTSDNESDLFFRYLLTALADVNPGLAGPIRSLLALPGPLAGKELVPFLIEQFVHLPRDFYIVLDDYHLIRSKEVHDAVSYLLERVPSKVHVVIVSRYAVPFSLGHFRVRNQIVEISASDMRFTEEETTRFLREIMALDLSNDEVHRLADHTEGWAGGLQLFGLSLKKKGNFRDLGDILAMARQETADYLVDEVVEAQPGKIKSFLRITALLGRFNTDLCREVTGLPDAAEILDHLYRNNLFLIPLDEEQVWYRYHHLFSEALRKGVQLSSPEVYRDIQRKAALWFAANGYLEDAFRHAFSSGDLEFAADLLEDYLLYIPDCTGYSSGLRWIAKVPYEILNRRALLRLHDCGQKVESFRLAEIEEILRDIEERRPEVFDRYEGRKKTLCLDLFTYFRTVIPYYYRDPENADVERLNEACKVISSENRQFAGYIGICIAMGQLIRGNPVMAGEALREASTAIFSSESLWARMLWFRYSAMVEGTQGHLHRSEALLKEALEMLDRRGLSESPLKSSLYLPMAWIAYYRNDLHGAQEYVVSAMAFGEQATFVRDVVDGWLLLLLIRLARGEPEEAARSVQKAREVVRGLDASDTVASLDAWIIRISMVKGDLKAAMRWADQRKLSMDEPFSNRFLHECLANVEVLHRQGFHEKAAGMLQELRGLCSDRNLMVAVFDIDLFYAGVLHALNDHEGAVAVMERAVAFADSEGFVKPMWDYGPLIAPIVLEMAGSRPEKQTSLFFQVLMESCGITREDASPLNRPATRAGDLTSREIEILKLMAAGYKNQEIAEKAFVSLPTIKTHNRHIFDKLDVKTRTQAIKRARELKLLGGQ